MSTQTRATTISGVTKKDTAKGELYIVATSDGTEYSTFQGALANQAYALIGQAVDLRFIEKSVTKQDGRSFINRYYEHAAPAAQTQLGAVVFGNAPAGVPLVSGHDTATPAIETNREIKIMRQTATKVAAHLLGHLPIEERTPNGLLAMADFLVDYYEHGNTALAVPSTLTADPGPEAPPAFVSDDDIPF